MGPSRLVIKPVPGSENLANSRKKWTNLMPIFIALVVIAEIAFLGRLDMAKNAAMVNSWADSLLRRSPETTSFPEPEVDACERWLEREDTVVYSRDFNKDPVMVSGGEKDWNTCFVGCKFGYVPSKKADAAFGWPQEHGIATVLRSMESSQYYAENNIANARRGYDIIMTTSLSSDVPVGYFSWAEYDIMAPVQPKTESALAEAFISNCGARNFCLQALEKTGITLDSYGACHHNRNEQGTIPVVVGAPNILDYAPGSGSVLHIKDLNDVDSVAKTMKYLAENPEAYNQSLRWKYEGPSDSFKALLDMAAVHSSCRICIHLATKIHDDEEKKPEFKKRPCKCSRGPETIYHLYVRERGRFEMESVFLRSSNLTMEALESAVLNKFSYLRHVPIWKPERPETLRGGDELKICKIYPLDLTQRQALYTYNFQGESDFRSHIGRNPCSKFEVIFV